MKTKLEELNQTIYDKELSVLVNKNEINNGQLRYETESLALMAVIANEKEVITGKPLYSNDNKRKVRFEELMSEGHSLKTLKDQLDGDEYKVKIIEKEISHLKRKFQIEMLFAKAELNKQL